MFREDVHQIYDQVGLEDLPGVAKQVLKDAAACRIWVFTGEMGAGKTTFIKAICSELGVVDNMSSPTFSIVNEYLTASSTKVFHFDFFRIKSEAEAYDIGTEEYFYTGNYCFIEWPEKIPGLLPDEYAHVTMTLKSDTLRTIAFSLHDGKEKNRI
jgi:tRNA threonylcarbamoyladenosine biosynthesis protein TsaE